MMKKSELRELMKAKREGMSLSLKENMDRKIYYNLIHNEKYVNAKNIFIYVSYKSEVNTHKIIENALLSGKRISVPKVISKKAGMKSFEIKSFSDLQSGKFGILEPHEETVETLSDTFDLIIVPGLAFDKQGGRLGYGGGYYDRFLCNLKSNALLLALAYDFQLINEVPMEKFDIRINGIITEKSEIVI